jgi:hypothetical protein
LGDYEQIARLESRYGLSVKGYDEWSHLWLANPVYQQLNGNWTIGWVIEDDNHHIVGAIGNIPLSYELGGKPILAASARSWVTTPAYRSTSLLLLDHVINQPQVELYLNTTFAPVSMPCASVFGCQPVPVGVWDKAAFWITHHRGFVESLFARKNYPVAKVLSLPVSGVLSLREGFARKISDEKKVEVSNCPGFDERFDDFWAELRDRSPHLLLAVRTREALEWHYKYALLNGRLWIATVQDGSRIIAYAVFDRRDRPDIALTRVRLVDFQSLDGSTALLFPVLSWALARCRHESIQVLESVGRWLEKGELIRTIAPYRRRLPAWRYYYRANNSALAERLRDRRVWAPSLFDGDASLVR